MSTVIRCNYALRTGCAVQLHDEVHVHRKLGIFHSGPGLLETAPRAATDLFLSFLIFSLSLCVHVQLGRAHKLLKAEALSKGD